MEFRALGYTIQDCLVREPTVLSFEAGNGTSERDQCFGVFCPDWSSEVPDNLLQLLISGMLKCSGFFLALVWTVLHNDLGKLYSFV